MYELRSYQKKAVQAALEFRKTKQDNKKGFIVSPTGSGKSLIIAGIANEITTPLVVMQPSKELLEQNYEKYVSYGNEASIYSASLRSKEIGHVTFATPGSIKSAGSQFKQLGVKDVIIDECHIGGGSSGMVDKFLKDLGKVKVVGLTATPIILMQTAEEGPMLKMLNRTRKSFYNHVLHITQVKEIIEEGFWTPLLYEQIKIDQSKLKYNTSRSEFTEESQIEVYEEEGIEKEILRVVSEIRERRESILIFVPSVQAAKELTAKIPQSEAVWGDMDKKKRSQVITDFKSNNLQVVINVNVLAIGFDLPELDTIIDASPTASFARYYQKLGRVCRPHPDKQDGLIVDISGNYLRFGELKDLVFEDDINVGWQMFVGNQQLTNIPLSGPPVYKIPEDGDVPSSEIIFTFGRYEGKPIHEAPVSYLNWIIKEFTFNSRNRHIYTEIQRLTKEREKLLVL